MKFTKASIAALQLPAGKSDFTVFDTATPGFGCRIREGGNKTWVAQMRVHGRTRKLTLGSVAQIDLEPARAAAKKFFAEATLGTDPIKARQEARAKAQVTVGAVVEKYLKAREAIARTSTRRHQQLYLRKYFASLHGMPIDSVTRRDVAIAVAAVAEKHGEASAHNARACLSAFYVWALKEGYAEVNPVTHTNDPGAGAKARDRVLKPEEVRAIWRVLPDTDYGKVIRLLFLTACRRAEIGNLEWSEVDFDRAMLTIPAHKMKGNREHRLPLVAEAIDILRSIKRRPGNSYVFGRRGFSSFSYCQGELNRCLAAMEDTIPHWTTHDVRRSVRSELGELGIEPWIAEQVLAHHRAGIEAVYNHAKLEKQMRQALGQWADRLRCIVDGEESTVVALRA
jgi:integrase